ncbi:MAG: EamA family transporter [Alphaproteobacteria bacterium]|nr:EamA family transporter [Alphaproteobacteria bacterium]
MQRQDWLLLFALAAIWGVSFFFVAVAVADLPPLTIAFGRVSVGALTLAAVFVFQQRAFPGRALWPAYVLLGGLNNAIPFTLTALAQQSIGSGLASILNATSPLWTVILAHAVGHERLTVMRISGILLGITGVAVLIGPAALADLGSTWGQLLVIGATVSYAFAGIYGRRFRDRPAGETAFGQVAGATVLLLPLMLWIDRPWLLAPGAASLGAILGIATLCTALAYPMYFVILRRAGATNAMLVTVLNPVTAVLLGTLVLGETLEWTMIAGMLLIAVGLMTLDGRLWPFTRLRTWRQNRARRS